MEENRLLFEGEKELLFGNENGLLVVGESKCLFRGRLML